MEQREIKFRIAHVFPDGKFSHFSYWGAIDYKNEHSDGDCFTSPASSSGTTKKWHQQFTGLKDKSGKEIYDQDILKDTLTGAILKVCFGYNRNGGYTGWYVEYLNIDRNGYGHINNDSDSDRNSQIEVIGNVFENPELLPTE